MLTAELCYFLEVRERYAFEQVTARKWNKARYRDRKIKIEADNTARQECNRTADLALVSGIEEAKILEIKQTEIHDKAGQSIRENGWLPNLFRGIVGKAKKFLQAIIHEKDMPPKPVLSIDMDEFRTMQTLC